MDEEKKVMRVEGISWLRLIEAELAEIAPDRVMQPQQEIDQRDRKIGEVRDETARRVYTLSSMRQDRRDRKLLDAREACRLGDHATEARLKVEADMLDDEETLLTGLFWMMAKQEVGGTEIVNRNLALRRGWLVVIEPGHEVPPVIRRLFGMEP